MGGLFSERVKGIQSEHREVLNSPYRSFQMLSYIGFVLSLCVDKKCFVFKLVVEKYTF